VPKVCVLMDLLKGAGDDALQENFVPELVAL
jgi:hypothetical protein